MKEFFSQQHRQPIARRGFGALVLLWVNLALLPCAWAFGSTHACDPQSAAMHDMADHHDHAAMQESHACDGLEAECCDVMSVGVDTRGDGGKLKVPGETSVALPAAWTALPLRPVAVAGPVADPPDPPGASAPPHVLFCVYLD